MEDKKTILLTGAAGFIGHHLAVRLVRQGHHVIGIDNLNDYYEPQLKLDRLLAAGIAINETENNTSVITSSELSGLSFVKLALEDKKGLDTLFGVYKFDVVINLAAQAGVRYSLSNPQAYVNSNVTGFVNVLECCREHGTSHLVYASSSSVYGLNDKVPFAETDVVEQPASLYAATKRSNELLAHVYGHLYGLPTTGLRFFTVYGPWGRPDMAYSLFSDAILNDRPIKIFNHGRMSRDFTYVDDIVEGLLQVCLQPRPAQSGVPARVYNIGAGKPVNLLDFVKTMESALGKTAEKKFMDMQPGDVEKTYADTSALEKDYGYRPGTDLATGIAAFVEWYRNYYKI
ncbi:NAD-dependent epimerase [Lewinellaceae bacterium SD302]|nr:NAD-dependent epimerase [Lewinellaceae bacterium SD302]